METIIPVLPCLSLPETLAFYQALGFSVTHEQTEPYVYGAVQRGAIDLHFTGARGFAKRPPSEMCLVMVPDIEPYHRAFADGLRRKYGRVPTAGTPRITRYRPGKTRFHLFDPTGNVLLFINTNEPEMDYSQYEAEMSPLARSLDKAIFLRDTYTDDESAARVLDKALARYADADPLERALALAARAEIAVALGDAERAQACRAELAQIPLSDEERRRYEWELAAADYLERWVTQADEETP